MINDELIFTEQDVSRHSASASLEGFGNRTACNDGAGRIGRDGALNLPPLGSVRLITGHSAGYAVGSTVRARYNDLRQGASAAQDHVG